MTPTAIHATSASRRIAVTGWASFVLIGWTSPIIPSLIRTLEGHFGQDDAGIGALYLVQAAAFTVGSLVGGFATERFGRRPVLVGALALDALGLAGMALAGPWLAFGGAAMVRGAGTGIIEGGVQGLFLDAFTDTSGRFATSRMLNLLHVAWSAGALAAPLSVAALIGVGVPWQWVFGATGVAAAILAVVFGALPMPSGRHVRQPGVARMPLSLTLLVVGAAIAAYVAAESGVAGWLVRFLADAPLRIASLGLTLFWGGLTAGRLVTARFGTGVDPVRLTLVASIAAGVSIAAAVVAPSSAWSIAAFTVAGFAFGPIYPMIMLIGGRLYPGRAAAITGMLSAAAVIGGLIYPPVMGTLSVSLGIDLAMLGTAILAVASGALAFVAARRKQWVQAAA
jgi:fucose permease